MCDKKSTFTTAKCHRVYKPKATLGRISQTSSEAVSLHVSQPNASRGYGDISSLYSSSSESLPALDDKRLSHRHATSQPENAISQNEKSMTASDGQRSSPKMKVEGMYWWSTPQRCPDRVRLRSRQCSNMARRQFPSRQVEYRILNRQEDDDRNINPDVTTCRNDI